MLGSRAGVQSNHQLQLPNLRASAAEANMGELEISLHKEIIDFYGYISTKRLIKIPAIENMLAKLREIILTKYPDFEIMLYGSFASGLAIESSDVDLQVKSESFNNKSIVRKTIYSLGNRLKNEQFVKKQKIISKAAVPVIKLEIDLSSFDVIKQGTINVDISIHSEGNRSSAQLSLRQTNEYLHTYPCLKYVLVVIKTFLSYRRLNDAAEGGISSYSLLLWMVSYIKQTQQDFQNFGDLLIGFLYFYGNIFDKNKHVVCPNSEYGFAEKEFSGEVRTIDPVLGENNTTKSAKKIDQVLRALKSGYSSLAESNRATLNRLFINNN